MVSCGHPAGLRSCRDRWGFLTTRLRIQALDFPNRPGRIASYSDRESLTPSGPADPFPFLLAIQDLVRLKSSDTLA